MTGPAGVNFSIIATLGMLLFAFCIQGAPEKPTHLQSLSLISTASAAESNIPVIPKPELLPGPSEEKNQAEVQQYFRNQAIPNFINGFLGFTGGLSILALVVAGVRFILAYGEEDGLTAAKKTATWAVIGFGLTISAYALVSIINTLAFPKGVGTYTPEQQEEINYEDI